MTRKSNKKASVLLTTVCRPFGGQDEGTSVGAELFHAQITRAQGAFSLRQTIRCWGLDYIAENIESPAMTLHYPSADELVDELEARSWDYVGINFVVATFHKMKAVVALVRKYQPRAQIVLGGYGTVLSDEQLEPFADHICRQEGVAYMRRLLGEDTERAIAHPYVPIDSPNVYSYQLPSFVAHVTAGLGCPNGCDFCCTSHFFNRQYVPFLSTGKALHAEILRQEQEAAARGDELSGFIIIDEDFFMQEDRAREYLECVRQGGHAPSLMGFGSVAGLSKFTADEVAEMGFHTIWTAFEGKRSGYAKLNGKPIPQLHEELRSRGIALLCSMIVGLPYQDKETVLAEFAEQQALKPCYTQILIQFAFPRTPLYETVLNKGLYLPQFAENPDYRKFDGFSLHFKHEHFSPAELEALQQELYDRDFKELGPSLVRINRTFFEGWKNLRDSEKPLLQERAQRQKEYVERSVPGLYPAIYLGPSEKARQEASLLLQEVKQELGSVSLLQRVKGWAAVGLALWSKLCLHMDWFQQPKLIRTEHRLQDLDEQLDRAKKERTIRKDLLPKSTNV